MEFKRGLVVRVIAGHDAGRFCVIVGSEEGFCMIADGKHRKLSQPKKKNIRHLAPTAMYLDLDEVLTDRQLRRSLWKLNNDHGEDFTHEGGK